MLCILHGGNKCVVLSRIDNKDEFRTMCKTCKNCCTLFVITPYYCVTLSEHVGRSKALESL